jgi:hypothetical protein
VWRGEGERKRERVLGRGGSRSKVFFFERKKKKKIRRKKTKFGGREAKRKQRDLSVPRRTNKAKAEDKPRLSLCFLTKKKKHSPETPQDNSPKPFSDRWSDAGKEAPISLFPSVLGWAKNSVRFNPGCTPVALTALRAPRAFSIQLKKKEKETNFPSPRRHDTYFDR